VSRLEAFGTSKQHLVEVVGSLYTKQLQLAPTPYLSLDANRNCILRRIDVLESILPFVRERCTILDWGCNHAPESCMLRYVLGDQVELHGCDFFPPKTYVAFHEFAHLH